MTCDYRKPIVTQGWRTFKCECGVMWSETTRDWKSPSLTICPKCTGECHPIDAWEDKNVEVSGGNLVKHQSTYVES